MKCARSAVLLLLLSVPVFSSAAQRPIGPVSLGVSAGLSTPQGDTRGFFDRGAQFGALADVRTALPWLLVRVDGSWQSLGRGQQQIISVDDGEVAQADYRSGMISGAVSIGIRPPDLDWPVRPYMLAGLGSYWFRTAIDFPAFAGQPAIAETRTGRTSGMHLGVGLEAPVSRMVFFVEGRVQRVGETPNNFVPLSVGLRLR